MRGQRESRREAEAFPGGARLAAPPRVQSIIADALRSGASNIHFAPDETGLAVRVRRSGALHDLLHLPAEEGQSLTGSLKALAGLQDRNGRSPQEGSIAMLLEGRSLDLGLSVLPGRAGERLLLRLPAGNDPTASFEALGMPPGIAALYRDALARAGGLILIVGPPESGRTTTLHAGLDALSDGTRNILALEDCVSEKLDGIGQTQVDPQAGLDYAGGLAAILRQDPDAVLLGNIEDRATAEIALDATRNGRLILSSMDAREAVGAVGRLREMKVEPFLLASTLGVVIAQRLVRRLCGQCREPVQASGSVSALLGFDSGAVIYEARGCSACGQTGYCGHTGVFEGIRVDDDIRRLINAGGDEAVIASHAFRNAPNLGSAARTLVRDGVTTAQEAVRISRHEPLRAPLRSFG